jgi:3-phosphoshikimate 1-carboxyvinyltransferase
MASAQVKSAILLAGLFAPRDAVVKVIEPEQSRDHTERMLAALGVDVTAHHLTVTLKGRYNDMVMPDDAPIVVPADISSAAFWMVGAAVLSGSSVTFERLGLNPSRLGIMAVMRGVGVTFEQGPLHHALGEPYGDVTVSATQLVGDITIDRELVPFLVDEIPILTVLGLFTKGTFTLSGAEELRVKESDRLGAMVTLLTMLGVKVDERPDGYTFTGNPDFNVPVIETVFNTHHDHRLVMALEILNLKANTPLPIEGREWVQTSYPSFYDDMAQLLKD